MSLRPPQKDFGAIPLPWTTIDASKLVRISSFSTGEPWFGKSMKNRFDDRRKLVKEKRFGTCYVGFSLECAFAETVLHNRVASRGGFVVPVEELERWVVTFHPAELKVAVLLGRHLKTLGGDGELSSSSSYVLPGKWAVAVHEHSLSVDGMLYMSKHVNDEPALVLFDRARHKLAIQGNVSFADCEGSAGTLSHFNVTVKRR